MLYLRFSNSHFCIFPVAIISDNSIKEFSDLGIIWHEGKNYERLNAYGNLLTNYADDSGTIYYKVRELGGKDVLIKDMERVYENGGDLKKTMNVVEKSEDGDGIPDSSETYSSQKVIGDTATVLIDGVGDVSKNTTIVNASGYVALANMPGSIGKVVSIDTTSAFTSATISIPYNESDLNGISENDLKMYYLNDADHSIVFLDVQGVDTANNIVWGKTNHFSTFGIVSYSTYIATWNSGSNPTIPEYTYGDKINIKAQVHNTGDADVTDNVLVYFYAGDPDAGGNKLGSATITGGIGQGGAKTAVLYGYTISSSAVDIYVKVDPLGSISEKSELNNKAFKTLSIGPQNFDSDGDGLTDAEEADGMQILYPYRAVYTDLYNPDTDGGGLSDREEMGTIAYYSNGKPYYSIISYADTPDSDNDERDDFEEVRQTQTIYAVNTLANAQNFLMAVYEGRFIPVFNCCRDDFKTS